MAKKAAKKKAKKPRNPKAQVAMQIMLESLLDQAGDLAALRRLLDKVEGEEEKTCLTLLALFREAVYCKPCGIAILFVQENARRALHMECKLCGRAYTDIYGELVCGGTYADLHDLGILEAEGNKTS